VTEISQLTDRLYDLLQKIRKNCVLLVDAFDWKDSNLCSALGVYDGNVYEKLYEFAKNSSFNKTDIHPGVETFFKPYMQKIKSKL
jgi:acyl-CoA oxidase